VPWAPAKRLGYRPREVAEETVKTHEAQATDGKAEASRPLPDEDTSRELLETMALIRRFEEEAGRQYQRGKAGGFLHLAIGEEATIVGTTSVMRPDDYLIGTYRTHGHAIARGTDPKRVMAELFGREDGTSRGRGGSMHIFDRETRFMGGYGIVGGNLPLALGLALASDYRGEDTVTVCMFGDGASNTGNFGETMNLAALWKLPVVFILENNLYGMGTSVERHSAVTDFSKKAEGLGVPGVRADGMDVLAMRETVTEHIRLARSASRPWSRPSRTDSAATPPPTPRSTGPRRRSPSGSARTPSRRSPTDSSRRGPSARETATSCASGSRNGFVKRSSSPTSRRSPRSSRCTRTCTCWVTRSPAGTPSTSAHHSRTAASASTRWAPRVRYESSPRPAPRTPARRPPPAAGPSRRRPIATRARRARRRLPRT
jgi:pyruvate dehydrogenase E1 component alpha subunit